MSDFADLVARAVNPSMTREEREAVYTVVREAILSMQAKHQLAPSDPQAELQRHLIEETIRDIELEIARHLAYRRLKETAAAQDREEK